MKIKLPEFIKKERITVHKNTGFFDRGRYGIYFLEASQRSRQNFALETAIYLANQLKVPLIVYFGLTDKYRFSNLRYYKFMLEGIVKLKKSLRKSGIKPVNLKADPPEGLIQLSEKASFIVLDRGYLKHQRVWRKKIIEKINLPIIEIEGDVIVPVEFISKRAEAFARTIRPKIMKYLTLFLEKIPEIDPLIPSLEVEVDSWEEDSAEAYLNKLNIDKTVSPVSYFIGGEDEAEKRLELFLTQKLPFYAELRSDPGISVTSELSPYLRFGQISPVQILLRVFKETSPEDPNVKVFVDQLVVWRELARNYAWYNPFYNHYEGLPLWARKTLEEHLKDKREYIYPLETLEKAQTHDPYWNHAQMELLNKGVIHNYLRMYWCKRLIAWTANPKVAFDYACFLNDKYALDGRDPNGYANIAWCFGAFDRPFFETPIYGKIRKMSSRSLTKKKYFISLLSNSFKNECL